MSNVVIRIEELSKQYRLGTIGTGTLSHDLNRWWHLVRGKNDPYQKVGTINDQTAAGSSEYVWALKNVNFDVKKGEVLGIIGNNGAGKSTLLKILSRVTGQTKGLIKVRGRIGSLLEVGTGFHPEMTGLENIFMNGTILGMTKNEIRSKLDEIVEFSGTQRYLDTPVKRYSSGMTVRLAFAVAAHLEPEILVVDEVLAVGDAEFQKKAIGKMKDVSTQSGRTILFVSHNMAAISSLCTRTLVLSQGEPSFDGNTEDGINHYLNIADHVKGFADLRNRKSSMWNQKKVLTRLISIETMDQFNKRQSTFKMGRELKIRVKLEVIDYQKGIEIGIFIRDNRQTILGLMSSVFEGFTEIKPGVQEILIEVPKLDLLPGEYSLGVWTIYLRKVDDAVENAIDVDIISDNVNSDFVDYSRFKYYGQLIQSRWYTA